MLDLHPSVGTAGDDGLNVSLCKIGTDRIGIVALIGKLAQDAAPRDLLRAHGGRAAEQVGPVGYDQRVARLSAHQRAQFAWCGGAIEHVEPRGTTLREWSSPF